MQLFVDVARQSFVRPFQWREFIQQAWFIASVTIIPTALVAIPFGAVIALQVGGLIKQFGAQSFTGSASVLAAVQQDEDGMALRYASVAMKNNEAIVMAAVRQNLSLPLSRQQLPGPVAGAGNRTG